MASLHHRKSVLPQGAVNCCELRHSPSRPMKEGWEQRRQNRRWVRTCEKAPAALRYSPRSAVLGPMHAWRGPHSAEVAMLRPYFPYRSFVVTIPNEAQVTMRKTRVWI